MIYAETLSYSFGGSGSVNGNISLGSSFEMTITSPLTSETLLSDTHEYESTLNADLTTSGTFDFAFGTGPSFSYDFYIPEQTEAEHYYGEYEYIPSFSDQTVLTANKYLVSNLTLSAIQTYETSNEYGTTFII